ncbi:MAG TPA: amidohydrolase family protein [Acetobacteraceae bacterium]|nr:amidohydrolase family protein [Acetobacteraceae bacterium]
MTRVDAHHHVWRLERGDYAWLTPGLPIHRDFGLHDLSPLLRDITVTVLVQAAPTEAETRFLLQVAQGSGGLVRGVVGWVDLAAADAPARIALLAGNALFKGLRPMLQDIEDRDWILRPEMQPALAQIAARGLVFDALIQPRHLPVVRALADRHPTLRIVIDHAAKPDIAAGGFQPWAAELAKVARETQAVCKLSGLVTEAAPDWRTADLEPYVEHMLDVFGPQRLMWGSDWPVVELAGGYARWRDATLKLLRHLPETARDAVLGNTAATVYRL